MVNQWLPTAHITGYVLCKGTVRDEIVTNELKSWQAVTDTGTLLNAGQYQIIETLKQLMLIFLFSMKRAEK